MLSLYLWCLLFGFVFVSSRRRHTRCALVTGVQTCALPILTSVVRASDRSFQVKWTETAYERGAQSGTQRWTAILTVVMRAPTDADTLRKNPLGVYVDAVDWSRELDPPAQSRPTPPPAAPPPVPAGLPLGSPLDPNLAAPTTSEEHPSEL